MSISEYIIFAFDLIVGLVLSFLAYYVRNLANLLTKRDESYESEKGKNLATKEDIEELTAKIETVKQEINYDSQRLDRFMQKQEDCLLNILFHSEEIINSWNTLLLYAKDYKAANRLNNLIDANEIAMLKLIHNANVFLASAKDKNELTCLTKLIDDLSIYKMQINVSIHNIVNYINVLDKVDNLSGKSDLDIQKKWIAIAGIGIDNIISKPFEKVTKEQIQTSQNQFITWLNRQYFKGFNIKSSAII